MPQAVAKFAATRDLEMEIDFLLAKSRTERNRNISPIEVKSGKRYSIVSLDKFRAKYRRFLDVPYVLHPKDLKVSDGVTYLPLYMASLLVACGRT